MEKHVLEDRIELGRIVRLQIQTASLKSGPPKCRHYDPAPLRVAGWLEMIRDGAVAVVDGETTVDVHNAVHAATKNRSGINPISIGFRSHYERMRERFDAHLVDGIAGENILVDSEDVIELDRLGGGLTIEGDDGRRVELFGISVAHPCVEFSRYALDDRAASPLLVSDALRFLDNGMRGYCASVASVQPLRVKIGDRVYATGQS